MLIPALLFNTFSEFLAKAVSQENKIDIIIEE